MVAFFLRHAVDVPYMLANWKDTFPARNRVRADDRVHSLQVGPDVFWSATRLGIELEPTFVGDLLEEWLGECAGQALQELLMRLANSIVDLIARSPESIYSASAS